jgi:hypothetical protein
MWRDHFGDVHQSLAYRLKPSWVRPTKKPGMVSYEVYLDDERVYRVAFAGQRDRSHGVVIAGSRNMQGYLGIEFAELPGQIFGSWPTVIKQDNGILCPVAWVEDCKDQAIALTPVKVWFKGEA